MKTGQHHLVLPTYTVLAPSMEPQVKYYTCREEDPLQRDVGNWRSEAGTCLL